MLPNVTGQLLEFRAANKIRIIAVNTQSRRVMEKAGLHYELTYFPPLAPIEGSEHGEVRYALDYAQWDAASQRKNLQDLS